MSSDDEVDELISYSSYDHRKPHLLKNSLRPILSM